MKIHSTQHAPKPVAAYSQAVEANGFIFCSGQVGLDPATGALVEGLLNQAERVFQNLQHVLAAAGSSFDRAVKVTIYLRDLQEFDAVNKVYERYVGDHRPARTTIGCGALPRRAAIEVDVIATR